MKKYQILISGIIITIVIDFIAVTYGGLINLKNDFIPNSFGIHTAMFTLSAIAIILLKKHVKYQISIPEIKKIFKPIALGFFASLVMNMIIMSIMMSFKGNDNTGMQMPTSNMSVMQIFIFVFIFASIAEELLFRGFLQNILNPLKNKGITLLKRKLSFPVIISAILFGLSHLILMNSDRNNLFVFGIVISASVLGIIAGYYQEKHNNNAYAILVHMAGNLMGIIGAIVMNFNS